MDRISALRNVEEALAAYEDGETTLPDLEREVRGVLRTYAADLHEEARPYRARGAEPADGLVVLAGSPAEARDRIDEHLPESVRYEVERLD